MGRLNLKTGFDSLKNPFAEGSATDALNRIFRVDGERISESSVSTRADVNVVEDPPGVHFAFKTPRVIHAQRPPFSSLSASQIRAAVADFTVTFVSKWQQVGGGGPSEEEVLRSSETLAKEWGGKASVEWRAAQETANRVNSYDTGVKPTGANAIFASAEKSKRTFGSPTEATLERVWVFLAPKVFSGAYFALSANKCRGNQVKFDLVVNTSTTSALGRLDLLFVVGGKVVGGVEIKVGDLSPSNVRQAIAECIALALAANGVETTTELVRKLLSGEDLSLPPVLLTNGSDSCVLVFLQVEGGKVSLVIVGHVPLKMGIAYVIGGKQSYQFASVEAKELPAVGPGEGKGIGGDDGDGDAKDADDNGDTGGGDDGGGGAGGDASPSGAPAGSQCSTYLCAETLEMASKNGGMVSCVDLARRRARQRRWEQRITAYNRRRKQGISWLEDICGFTQLSKGKENERPNIAANRRSGETSMTIH